MESFFHSPPSSGRFNDLKKLFDGARLTRGTEEADGNPPCARYHCPSSPLRSFVQGAGLAIVETRFGDYRVHSCLPFRRQLGPVTKRAQSRHVSHAHATPYPRGSSVQVQLVSPPTVSAPRSPSEPSTSLPCIDQSPLHIVERSTSSSHVPQRSPRLCHPRPERRPHGMLPAPGHSEAGFDCEHPARRGTFSSCYAPLYR